MTSPWLVIPARGGSRGVPRKNLRPLVGLPLIAHTIKIALAASEQGRVIVITDDDEIEEVAEFYGAKVIREATNATGLRTLDELMVRHLKDLKALGALPTDIILTMQPTCPLISPLRVSEAVAEFHKGAGSVITVKDDRHLTWKFEDGKPVPGYEKRVNRQQLPLQFRESGAIIGARFEDIESQLTRIVEPVSLVVLEEHESLDIDTFADLVVAEHWLTRKRILLHADAGKELGMGHVYRTLALAQELARHEVLVVTSKEMELGGKFFESQVFSHQEISTRNELAALAANFEADLVVLDILDTSAELVSAIKETGAKVVTFEDLGPGALIADLSVSDLYPNPELGEGQLTGVKNAILAPSFETLPRVSKVSESVAEILVLFGGTDPSGLAAKTLSALEAIKFKGKVTCVRGLGADDLQGSFDLDLRVLRNVVNMGKLMSEADLAFSSAGRTITELMSIGVPTIALAQNQKEMTHTHASAENGVLNLGLGSNITSADLEKKILEVLADNSYRVEQQKKALAATRGRSNSLVVKSILEKLEL